MHGIGHGQKKQEKFSITPNLPAATSHPYLLRFSKPVNRFHAQSHPVTEPHLKASHAWSRPATQGAGLKNDFAILNCIANTARGAISRKVSLPQNANQLPTLGVPVHSKAPRFEPPIGGGGLGGSGTQNWPPGRSILLWAGIPKKPAFVKVFQDLKLDHIGKCERLGPIFWSWCIRFGFWERETPPPFSSKKFYLPPGQGYLRLVKLSLAKCLSISSARIKTWKLGGGLLPRSCGDV